MPIHHRSHDAADATIEINPLYARAGETRTVPKLHLPQGELPPDLAYQIVHDELMLDGNARLNLATFVTTWMDPQAQRLMDELVDKNVIDKDEYPQTAELERRCVHMLAGLWHATGAHAGVGCSTTGSSEAAMLAGLALKWRWRQRRRAAGLPVDKPNLVMGINVQVCWEKFCRYWDVEPRYVPMEGERRHLTAETAVPLCDENTIGVVAVLGSTQDGSYEPVAAIAAALEQLATGGGPDVPLHVDAASGGFIAPFIQPDLRLGFPARASGVDQHLRPQVRTRLSWRRLGDLAGSRSRCRRSSSSTSTTSAAACRPSRSTSRGPVRTWSRSTTSSSAWDSRDTGACNRHARTRRCTFHAEIARLGPFRLLTDGSELPVFAFTVEPDAGYTCTTSRTRSASAAGRCLHTRCAPTSKTSPCFASWCAMVSRATCPTCSSMTSNVRWGC